MPKSSLSKARASRQQIMDAAAKCIALKGYDGTTMRDIASTAKFLPGSIYYHFSSKDDLLLALNEEATSQISDRVLSSIDGITDPWVRIERACCAYLQCLSKDNYYALVALTEFPRRRSTELEEKLIQHRERFENIFRGLVEDLPLDDSVDRKYWRLSLLGTLAWAMIWYKDTGDDVDHVASTFVRLLAEKTAK